MSNCYGTVSGDMSRTEGTRRGSNSVTTVVKTWSGSVTVTITKDNQAMIYCDKVDVVLNGYKMYRERRRIDDLTMSELMTLLKTSFRKEVKRLRFPDKEFKLLKRALDAKMVMAQLDRQNE